MKAPGTHGHAFEPSNPSPSPWHRARRWLALPALAVALAAGVMAMRHTSDDSDLQAVATDILGEVDGANGAASRNDVAGYGQNVDSLEFHCKFMAHASVDRSTAEEKQADRICAKGTAIFSAWDAWHPKAKGSSSVAAQTRPPGPVPLQTF